MAPPRLWIYKVEKYSTDDKIEKKQKINSQHETPFYTSAPVRPRFVYTSWILNLIQNKSVHEYNDKVCTGFTGWPSLCCPLVDNWKMLQSKEINSADDDNPST